MSTTGSLRGANIDGIEYRAPADVDAEISLSPFETTAIPTSGETVQKMEIKSPDISSVSLSVTPDEAESLKDTAKKTEDYALSLVLADGTEYKAQGRINFENYTSAEGKATVTLMPNNALKGWQKF